VAEFRIRPAAAADIPILVQQRQRMFQAMERFGEAEVAAIVEAYVPYIQRALGEGAYRGYLAETPEGKVVAGSGVMLHDRLGRRRAYICNVYTEPEYRRQGLARQLVETAIAWCCAEGFTSIDLHASDAGRPLYASLGFEPTNEMRLTFK
jgi:GNAT superfamily N-acetyltransferase